VGASESIFVFHLLHEYYSLNTGDGVMAVQQSDGLEIEAVFQSFGPGFDAPVQILNLALRSRSLFQKGSKADSNKSKKIFVGGIPHNCGEPELRDYFNRFGVVSPVKMVYYGIV
jgi:hypothetical protein